MKKIKLTQGKVTLVDDEDFEWLNKFKWYAHLASRKYYAARSVLNKKIKTKSYLTIKMHRQILGFPEKGITDHIDGNSLNNQRENLRLCNSAENQWNRDIGKNNTSGYRGVIWIRRQRRWASRLCFNKKLIHGGSYLTKIEAAKSYNNMAKKYYGEFAKLNKIRKASNAL